MGQGFYQNLSFSFLGQIFQYYLLGLKTCRLRFELGGCSLSFPKWGIVVGVREDLGVEDVELRLGGGGAILGARRKAGGLYTMLVLLSSMSIVTPATLRASL